MSIKCDVTFNLLQFKIHLNLKTDQDYEAFYEKCKYTVLSKDNHFKSNLKEVCTVIVVHKSFDLEDNVVISGQKLFLKVITNYIYLFSMGLLIIYLGHVFILIFIHLLQDF